MTREFFWVALGGLGVGALLGWGFATAREAVTRRVGDVAATQMVLLLVLLPFAAYLAGEYIGVSGILSAVAAGVTTNFADLRRGEFVAERLQTEGTWTLLESAFNGAIFLLLGLQLPSIVGTTLHAAGGQWWIPAGQAVAISIALLGLRWIWLTLGVRGSLWRVHERGHMTERPSPLLTLATTLAGIRGAVTLAGALSLPLMLNSEQAFPGRDLIIFLATGTILCTLVIGSIGLPLVLKRMPLPGEPPQLREERAARLAACRAAIAQLAEAAASSPKDDDVQTSQVQEAVGRLTQDYRKRMDLLEEPAVVASTPEAQAESAESVRQRRRRYLVELELRLQALQTERQALYDERQAHRINDESLRSLVAELDLSEVSLRQRLRVARRSAGEAVGDDYRQH
jgi:CPA1 family monovalent cation:H+ antiporter